MGVCSSLRGTKDSRQNRALAWSFCPNTGVNSACNLHADVEFVDSITLLAPPWGSAVHFGGPKIRVRIALSLGAVRPNTGGNSACNLHAYVEFVDGITLLAPPWGVCSPQFTSGDLTAGEQNLQSVHGRRIRRHYHTSGSLRVV